MSEVRSSESDRERDRELQELVGRTVGGKYAITRLIGRGGMGAVYEAENLDVGKKVALKFIDREWAKDEVLGSRFAREARAANAVESEHIITVFDAGTDGDRPYLVMELLRGEDLGSRLRRLVRVPLKDALHVIAQVLRGLASAHAAGIVHRDLKPDNVFLTERGGDELHVTIVDFGISKIERPKSGTSQLALTQKGIVLGTPLYMAPEQAQAFADLDARADLYSVGAILFECLAGRPPHTGETYEQIIVSICMKDAPDLRAIVPSVPDDVAALVARALERDRTQRFQSASLMLAALREIAPADPATRAMGGTAAASPAALTLKAYGAPRIEASPAVVAPSGPPTDVSWSGARVSAPALVSLPRPRSGTRAVLVATAVIATIAGVAATLGVVSATRSPSAAASLAPVAAAPSKEPEAAIAATRASTTAPPPIPQAEETVAIAASTSPPPTPPPTAAPRRAAPAVPPTRATQPRPKSSGIDIQRELP